MATITLSMQDSGRYFRITSNTTVVVPANAAVPLMVNTHIRFRLFGAAVITFDPDVAVTFHAPALTASGDGIQVELIKAGLNEWDLLVGGGSSEYTESLVATETFTGPLVNIHAGGIRMADASLGREAHGFVDTLPASGATASVKFSGRISGLTGVVAGQAWLGNAGQVTQTPPSGGATDQQVGIVLPSGTDLAFLPKSGFGTV